MHITVLYIYNGVRMFCLVENSDASVDVLRQIWLYNEKFLDEIEIRVAKNAHL